MAHSSSVHRALSIGDRPPLTPQPLRSANGHFFQKIAPSTAAPGARRRVVPTSLIGSARAGSALSTPARRLVPRADRTSGKAALVEIKRLEDCAADSVFTLSSSKKAPLSSAKKRTLVQVDDEIFVDVDVTRSAAALPAVESDDDDNDDDENDGGDAETKDVVAHLAF